MTSEEEKGVRLNRYLASCDVASRRGAEEFIRQGRVEINGSVVTDLGTRVFPDDYVRFDGKVLRSRPPLTVALHKPPGYLCTRDDPEGRDTIYDLLPGKFGGLHYIGRLDYQSSGLILLTNSGELTERLTHPRYHVEKEYEVQLDRGFDMEQSKVLLEGMPFTEGLARMESITPESRRRLRVVLTQGFNRQIRRMFSKLGYSVKRLERIRIGRLEIPFLSPGEHQVLNHRDIDLASQR